MKIRTLRMPSVQGGRVTVIFDDATTMKILPVVAADSNLYEGKEFDETELQALREQAGEASAKSRAVRIISATGVSKKDLERRLVQKGETPQDAQNAVAWLDELKLLDDAQIARRIVENGAAKGYGSARIKQMLYQKQIPREFWDEALAALPEMDDAIDRYLAQTLHGREPDRKELKKTIDALVRRGHSWQDIHAALRRYSDTLDAIPEDEL